jgi:5'-3' exonuclease
MTQSAFIPARPASIALVDLSYLFKKRYHTVGNDTPMAAAKATLRDVGDLKRGVAHVIICRDAGPYEHRLAISKDYKANRPEVEPEEKAQRRWLFEQLKRAGFNIAWCQGYEADDVIATLAKAYSEWCEDVRIVGTDKDSAQCISRHVTQYIPPVATKDWEIRDVSGVMRKFGVVPSYMPLWQGLVGDDGDNIPGVMSIGPKKATELCNKYNGSLEKLELALASEARDGVKRSATTAALVQHWETLVMSVKLATLDIKVPLDIEGLLLEREPEEAAPPANDMDIVGDPAPENDTVPVVSSKDGELLEQETDRERAQSREVDAVSNAPGDKAAERVGATRAAAVATTALATTPAYTQSKYGLVTSDLQPLDLHSAYTVSEWLCNAGLYPQFKTPAQVFTIIARGKELGIGMTTALSGFHIVEGKPAASADLIRALAERDPNFEYLMPIEIGARKVVWQGKHKKQPVPVSLSYTIEEADQAGLVRASNYGKQSNWQKRPQDMLMKTAASKLARYLWPGATLGLYCTEELGYAAEELGQREAA